MTIAREERKRQCSTVIRTKSRDTKRESTVLVEGRTEHICMGKPRSGQSYYKLVFLNTGSVLLKYTPNDCELDEKYR